jgi:hypothetical protein
MVNVSVDLLDAQERTWFGQFMAVIDQYRASPESVPSAPPPQEATPTIVTPAGVPAEVIATITPSGVTMPASFPTENHNDAPTSKDLPTDAHMFNALREVLRKEGGYAAAQAILARHGVTKVTDEMTDDVRVALFAELTK